MAILRCNRAMAVLRGIQFTATVGVSPNGIKAISAHLRQPHAAIACAQWKPQSRDFSPGRPDFVPIELVTCLLAS